MCDHFDHHEEMDVNSCGGPQRELGRHLSRCASDSAKLFMEHVVQPAAEKVCDALRSPTADSSSPKLDTRRAA